MFGYVRPVLSHMAQEEKEAYQSIYCGLCHTMGQRHGFIARLTLNYDFTLLALLHYGSSAEQRTECRRCPVHLLRKPRVCFCGHSLEAAADESVILAWYKLSDDVSDHGFITGIPWRVLQLFFRRSYRRAAKFRPEFDAIVSDEMKRLKELERQCSTQLDRVADTFAKILAAAASDCAGDASRFRVMKQLLYHLGRWIYLVDAWDDLDKDKKASRYNPLDARFGGAAAEQREYIETTMTHSVRMVCAAANLLNYERCQSLVENILYQGLPTVQKAVLDRKWKELRKQGRRINERSV